MNKILLYTCFALCLSCSEKKANEHAEKERKSMKASMPGMAESLEVKDTIKLIPEALGKFTRKVSTDVSKAQDYFNQGIQLKYAFAVNDAAISFRQAIKADSTCTMCYFGEAWALGSYLNGAMSEKNAPRAYQQINIADSLANISNTIDPIEKALINAMKVRYIEDYVKDERRVQDSLYALAMEKVYLDYPNDKDVATIYAEALFLLEPRRGTREMDDPDVMKIHAILEKVLEKSIEHPGACHLYIHATESTNQPELGESCADYLGTAIPGASHINHMPSHTWNEIGKWSHSVRANLMAVQSDQKAKKDKAFAIYPSHNLHMLLYAASFDGQGAIAMQAARDYTKMTGNNLMEIFTYIRFGRSEEILSLEDKEGEGLHKSIGDFGKGYAYMKRGELDLAKVYQQRVEKSAESLDDKFRFHPAEQILGILGNILKGEILLKEDNITKAIDAFKRAVEIEDEMQYDEPEVFPFDSRHWLGAALLSATKNLEAENVYNLELADHPNNGWSYAGLIRALESQGEDASEIRSKFDESWARADVYINGSLIND